MISELTRGDVLYRRTRSFAKAAFVVAPVVFVAGIALACFLGEGSAPYTVNYAFYVAVSYLERAFLIAGSAVLALTAARAAGSDSRPSWAPLIDEKFARWADAFAMCAYGFAALYLIITAMALVQQVCLYVQAISKALTPTVHVRISVDWLASASVLFMIVSGALIIQALVLVATQNYATTMHAEEPQIHE
jgi:hypothetical protein